MVLEPRNEDDIYDEIRDDLEDEIEKISNFTEGSFNNQFLGAFAEQARELELRALASQLAGYADYSGKELTDGDLDRLGLDGVDTDEINQYVDEEDLDRLAANVSVERDPGSRATGQVTFELTDDEIEIPEGYIVSTDPDTFGGTRDFRCDVTESGDIDEGSEETVSPDDGETELTVNVIADEVGESHNVGPGQVTYMPNPRPGILSVTNNNEMSGGQDEQSNESLREDVKNAIFEGSGGGTKSGIEGLIETESESGVHSASVQEFVDENPPFVDVIVDGGDESEIEDLIAEAKPVGIRHTLVRPNSLNLSSLVEVVSEETNVGGIQEVIFEELSGMDVGESFYRTKLISEITQFDSSIVSVPGLTIFIDLIENERITFEDSQNVYELQFKEFGDVRDEQHLVTENRVDYETRYPDIDDESVVVTAVIDDERRELDDTEFTVEDQSGDGDFDTISLDSVEPDDGSILEITYEHGNHVVDAVENVEDDTVYEKGTDYDVIDSDGDGLLDSIDWSIGGDSPSDGERFRVDYQPRRSFGGDLLIDQDQKFDSVDTDRADVSTYEP